MKNNTNWKAALMALCMTAATASAQAPHPERHYLSGTGIDNTATWDFFCSKGQNSG